MSAAVTYPGGSAPLSVTHAKSAATPREQRSNGVTPRPSAEAPMKARAVKPSRERTRHELERRRIAGTVLDPKGGRRWDLQLKAGQIMREVEIVHSAWKGDYRRYVYRVSLCNRGINGFGTESRGLEVFSSPDGLRAEFRGIQTCGSVWHCPVCSPKIARERVGEINLGMKRWQNGYKGQRGRIFFGTFTYQHERHIAGQGQLAAQLKQFSAALSDLKGDRAYRRIVARVGYRGAVRGLETTFGELNGWHNHTHEIMFVGSGLGRSLRELRRLYYAHATHGLPALSPRFAGARVRQCIKWAAFMASVHVLQGIRKVWARKLIALGMSGLDTLDTPLERRKKLRALLRRCYLVQHGQFACDYVAKFGKEPEAQRGRWGLASELTRSHLKTAAGDSGRSADEGLPARCRHASPWQLLNDALDGDKRSAELFREYGEAFHGKRQLYWSPGLKGFLDVDEPTDDELAAKPDQRCTHYVGAITHDQWRAVLAAGKRWTVLCIAARDGREHLIEYLESLERSYRALAVVEEDDDP